MICIIAAAYSTIWQKHFSENATYLELEETESGIMTFLIAFGTWFLAMMNFVSISLLVTLEMVKFAQAYFISNDILIFDDEKGIPAAAQSSNLNEELGMIHYIFSDKTGTLTKNIMEFKKCTVKEDSYGTSNP